MQNKKRNNSAKTNKTTNKPTKNLSRMLDLPHDIVLDLPKITMIGDIQVYVENHKGIIEYTSEKIRISTSLGQLIVDGKELVVRNICMDEIYIDGQITKLDFVR